MDSLETVNLVKSALLSKKATQIVVLDVRGISPVTDYYVIASGSAAPQLKAMFGAIQQELKPHGLACYRRSGVPDDGWVVLDYLDVVIHIFLQELRDYYEIEALWADAPRLA